MDDDEYEFMVELPSPLARRFRKIDLLIVGLSMLSDMTQAVADNATLLHDIVAMHANFKIDQDLFHEEAAMEIEALIADAPEED